MDEFILIILIIGAIPASMILASLACRMNPSRPASEISPRLNGGRWSQNTTPRQRPSVAYMRWHDTIYQIELKQQIKTKASDLYDPYLDA